MTTRSVLRRILRMLGNNDHRSATTLRRRCIQSAIVGPTELLERRELLSSTTTSVDSDVNRPDFLEVFDGAEFSDSWTSVGSGWSIVDGLGELDMASAVEDAELVFDLPASTRSARAGGIVNLSEIPDTGFVHLMAIRINGNASGVYVETGVSGGNRYIKFVSAGTYNVPTVSTANFGATTNVTTNISFQKTIMPETAVDDISFEVVFDEARRSIVFYVNGLFIGSSFNGSTATSIEQVVVAHNIHGSSSPGRLKLKKFGVSYNNNVSIVTPKIPLIWVGGQSNMVGFGGAGDYQEGEDYGGDHAYYDIATNTPQALNINRHGDLASRNAPTIYYHYLRNLTDTFAGGKPFILYDAAGSSGFTAGELDSHNAWRNENYLYRNAAAALTKLFSLGGLNLPDFSIHSMIWHQGETDAALGGLDYTEQLGNLETMLRVNGMGFDAPFIAGQIAPDAITAGACWNAGYNSINAELLAYANASPKRGFVSAEGLTGMDYDADKVHLDGAGLRKMGLRYAQQFQVIRNNEAQTLVSLTRANARTTMAESIAFDVVFSTDVVNVDETDFDFVATGSVAATIAAVDDLTDGDDSTFRITVTGVTGRGTLRLDLAAGHDIHNAAGLAVDPIAVIDEAYNIAGDRHGILRIPGRVPGNVNASAVNGKLFLSGDAGDNGIMVSVNASREVVVAGVGETTINGQSEFVAFSGTNCTIPGALIANSGGGNDLIIFDGVTLAGDALVLGGDGTDAILLTNVSAGRDLKLQTQDGDGFVDVENSSAVRHVVSSGSDMNDQFTLTNTTMSGSLVIFPGAGTDAVAFDTMAVTQNVLIRSTLGSDHIQFDGLKADGALTIQTGGDADTVIINTSEIRQRTQITTNDENDIVSIADSNFLKLLTIGTADGDDNVTIGRSDIDGILNLPTGMGADDITVNDGTIVRSTLNIRTDAGNDTVIVDHAQVYGRTSINTQNEHDVVQLDNSLFEQMVTINTGGGNDTVTGLNTDLTAGLSVLLGDGDDIFDFDDLNVTSVAQFITGTGADGGRLQNSLFQFFVSIRFASPANLLDLDHNQFAFPVTVSNAVGLQALRIRNNRFDAVARLPGGIRGSDVLLNNGSNAFAVTLPFEGFEDLSNDLVDATFAELQLEFLN